MPPTLTDTLCTRCALCCDGSLFADLELAGEREAAGLEILGLEVEDDDAGGAVLMLPCTALKGKRCGMYAHRPGVCRTFECGLLQDVRCGALGVERAEEIIRDAVERVARVKGLLLTLGQRDTRLTLEERCAEALATDTAGSAEVNRTRVELEGAMSAVEALLGERFLAGRGSGGRTDRS